MEETEIWKSLDFIGYPDYEVSNWGNVKSLNYRHTGKEGILKPHKNRGGYLQLHLSYNSKQKTFTVHKLVCLAFLENPKNYNCINHKDENKKNNNVNNLEWVSPKENINYGTRNERVSKKLKGKPKSEEHKRKMRKPIIQYTKDMVFIRVWDSAKSVNLELNIDDSSIIKCCKGKLKTCGSFIWRYKQ